MFTVAVAGAPTFPAASVQVPVAVWPVPSFTKLIGAEQESIPERLPVPVKDTVTLVLFRRAVGNRRPENMHFCSFWAMVDTVCKIRRPTAHGSWAYFLPKTIFYMCGAGLGQNRL